jgi:hypothetical protein
VKSVQSEMMMMRKKEDSNKDSVNSPVDLDTAEL